MNKTVVAYSLFFCASLATHGASPARAQTTSPPPTIDVTVTKTIVDVVPPTTVSCGDPRFFVLFFHSPLLVIDHQPIWTPTELVIRPGRYQFNLFLVCDDGYSVYAGGSCECLLIAVPTARIESLASSNHRERYWLPNRGLPKSMRGSDSLIFRAPFHSADSNRKLTRKPRLVGPASYAWGNE
jgi:hypothetical protein